LFYNLLDNPTNFTLIDIEVGDWEREPSPERISTPTESVYSIDETSLQFRGRSTSVSELAPPRSPPRMNLRSARYYTAKEVRNGALERDSDLDSDSDISTQSFDVSEADFEASDRDAFDPILGGDYNSADDNMDID
jgi:hypothetical protein